MISQATIEAVKARTNIADLIGETMRITRRGRAFLGLCPFHKEKSPSFSVNPERGVFYCFGCKEHGGAIDFVMKSEGLTFPEAVRSLAERAGIEVQDGATDNERREAEAARRAKDDLYAVNALAATFYEFSMRGGPGVRAHTLAPLALAEMERRGLDVAGAAVQAFRVGYAPHAWDGLTAYLAKNGVSPATAERVGLLIPRTSGDGHYDRFRHRLMFPVLDVSGRVIAFSGRALPESDGAPPLAEKPAKYINSPESPIYTKGEHLFGLYQARQAIRQRGDAALVEGNFDVVGLHARGIANVVAPLGTAFTETQARLLKRFTPSVTVMFDGDAAGNKATFAARVPCRAAGLSARAVAMPRGLDPDDLAQKRGHAAVRTLLLSAQPITHRLLDILLRDGEMEGKPIHDQATRARAAVQLITEAGDEIERTMLQSYAEQLTASLGVGSVAELEALARPRAPRQAEPAKRLSLAEELSVAMLGALLDFPALLGQQEIEAPLSAMAGDAVFGVLAMRDGPIAEDMVDRMPESIRPYVARRLAAPVFDTTEQALGSLCAYARTITNANRPRAQQEPA